MKKSSEQKLIGQIDRLKEKQTQDTLLMSRMVLQVEPISCSSDQANRKKFNDTKDEVDKISQCFERRKRLLKRKGEKLSEIRTALLVAESLS